MNDELQITNDDLKNAATLRAVFVSSFVIRHSSFSKQ